MSSTAFFNIIEAKTLNTVKKTGLPFYHFPEHKQQGTSFGERLSNAISCVFNKGYQRIITVGSDIPHLNASILNKSAKRLQHQSYVLGPSTDGGFYLIGLNKNAFNKDSFIRLPWETKTLKHHFISELSSKNVKFSLLEPLYDIDSSEDIISVLKSSRHLDTAIKRILQILIPFLQPIYDSKKLHIKDLKLSKLFNKGSPVALLF